MKRDAERDLIRAERRLAWRRQQLERAQQQLAEAAVEVERLRSLVSTEQEPADD